MDYGIDGKQFAAILTGTQSNGYFKKFITKIFKMISKIKTAVPVTNISDDSVHKKFSNNCCGMG